MFKHKQVVVGYINFELIIPFVMISAWNILNRFYLTLNFSFCNTSTFRYLISLNDTLDIFAKNIIPILIKIYNRNQ